MKRGLFRRFKANVAGLGCALTMVAVVTAADPTKELQAGHELVRLKHFEKGRSAYAKVATNESAVVRSIAQLAIGQSYAQRNDRLPSGSPPPTSSNLLLSAFLSPSRMPLPSRRIAAENVSGA